MKSPFLVAAQMKASSLDKLQQDLDASEEGGRSSEASSSSLSSSTSSLNGYSSSSTAFTSSATTPSSKKSKKRKQKHQQTQVERQPANPANAANRHATNMPDLDALPGSLQLARAGSASLTRSSTEDSHNVAMNGNGNTTAAKARSRANTRAMREAERHRKAKRRSTAILVTSALPIVAVLVYDHLYPAHVRLSTEHTRQASWHLTTLASKCLHLSYELPSGSSSALSQLFHLTNSRDLQSPSAASSTSRILSNALSTAPTEERYLKGFDDIYLVLIWVAVWTFFREFVIRFVCGPIGRYGGIRKSGALLRFGEQGYDVISHVFAVTIGTFIMQNHDSGYRFMNLDGLWRDYPHYKMAGSMKLYYLGQMGFWLQQVLTLHLEKRRKDYSQMFIHHIITVSLLYLSYLYNFTRIGNVILVLMDVSDIVLGSAKMLKYLKHETLCDIAFGLFMLSWIVTRHILYPRVLYSVIYDSDQIIHLEWNPEKEWYYARTTKYCFVALLSALQVLLILWFFMIVKVAVGVLRGKPAEDSRSDDEEDSEETVTDGSSYSSISPSPSSATTSHSKSGTPMNGAAEQSVTGNDTTKKALVNGVGLDTDLSFTPVMRKRK